MFAPIYFFNVTESQSWLCVRTASSATPNDHSMPIIYLALGTNLGEREANLREALQKLPPTVEVLATSRLYETTPMHVVDQPNFLNMVVKAQTALTPTELLTYLQNLEKEIGREKTFRYGPRKIDLDILFYDDWLIDLPDLQVPHLRLAERGFVLYPMLDLAPDLRHPQTQQTIQELAAQLPDEGGILQKRDFVA
jgi:2-amino-4-hydroxy-6-hydroxymethyldihydropteridine diphosphokinase